MFSYNVSLMNQPSVQFGSAKGDGNCSKSQDLMHNSIKADTLYFFHINTQFKHFKNIYKNNHSQVLREREWLWKCHVSTSEYCLE
jgi:hypothetical protein